MAISIEKEAPELLSLVKKSQVEIQKQHLEGQRAKVGLCIDFSGSMSKDYKNGSIQRLAEKVLALSTHLDDDGNIDLFVFDTNADYLGEISLSDYKGAVERLTAGRHMGRTFYAKPFALVRNHYNMVPANRNAGFFKSFKKPANSEIVKSDLPIFMIFLTDGAPDDKTDAVRTLSEVSAAPIFWKFLSIGPRPIEFLQKLDDLKDRHMDNADYQYLGTDVEALSDEKLFEAMLVEYRDWLAECRRHNMIG
ncbi:MAG: VWA domain-containing protein [Enterococcus sp.]|nr:VWA domain-containing protein [Enterococcus sp.]